MSIIRASLEGIPYGIAHLLQGGTVDYVEQRVDGVGEEGEDIEDPAHKGGTEGRSGRDTKDCIPHRVCLSSGPAEGRMGGDVGEVGRCVETLQSFGAGDEVCIEASHEQDTVYNA